MQILRSGYKTFFFSSTYGMSECNSKIILFCQKWNSLMISTLGKFFSRRCFFFFFLSYFPRKQDVTFHANCLNGDNLHEMSNLFLGKIIKLSPFCCLLNEPREW